MYARRVGNQVLTFGVSGMLFRDGLVMYDRETDTLWTHVDGRAVRGKLQGQILEIVPAVHATWKEWKTLYPQSLVLKKQGRIRSSYEDYNRDRNRMGILGRRLRDQRLPAKERIIGVRSFDGATAFVEKDVRAAKIVEAQVGSLPIAIVAAAPGLPIVVFERRVGERTLSFRLVPNDPTVIQDNETATRWSLAHGDALEGPLWGSKLIRATAYPAFWFGWEAYFPATAVWKR